MRRRTHHRVVRPKGATWNEWFLLGTCALLAFDSAGFWDAFFIVSCAAMLFVNMRIYRADVKALGDTQLGRSDWRSIDVPTTRKSS